MTFEIIFVFLLLIVAVFLFVTDYVTFDVTAIIIMACLLGSGILTPAQGLSGFSNPATVTVAAMFVLSEGMRRTGILNTAGDFFSEKMQESFKYWFFVLLLFICIISAFINNTAAVAIFIPVIMGIASKVGVSPSRMLMPLSFAGMIGGTTTLIGTSTNILVSSIAVERGMSAISMFELTPMGLIFIASGFLFLFTIGIKIIPERRKEDELTKQYEMQHYLTDIRINEGSSLVGTYLDEEDLTKNMDLDVIRVFKQKEDSSAQRNQIKIEGGDILRIRGNVEEMKKLMKSEDVSLLPSREWMDKDLEHGRDAIVEAVIAPESSLVKTKLGDFPFYENIGAVPLAIRQRGEVKHDDLADIELSGGDSILLSMNSERTAELEDEPAFVLVSKIQTILYRQEKTFWALGILAGVVFTAAVGFTSIVVSAVIGVILMIVTGCLRTEEAYEAINWKVIMLLAGVLPLGTAMDKTGAAELMASGMVDSLAAFGPTILMSGFFLLTILITAVMSNNASAALLAPIAIEAANTIDVNPEAFLYAVTFAASLSLITPFGYQTNTMIYGPGHYTIKDFLKIGIPLNVIFWILATIFIPIIWPF
ncbi:SLC13 family permease [Rhodohalobacter sulfatireducens]|uniref:SLC13 family permease n=1 Tax=Rhodohalobacter sulfatireducens TaxID=2911366 RepID=A0ABS9KAW0_9BACT|nr:SLC13 family permease [Rhodohalobacter sulfatireducens]MCG2587976.1 SLC13 family permease [Rhodohalobacter sulfatireducens]MDR9365101.1 SLC13 family permease [Balneolaceae bacterium]